MRRRHDPYRPLRRVAVRSLVVVVLVGLVAACAPPPADDADQGARVAEPTESVVSERMMMGTLFQIRVVAGDKATADAAVEAAYDEIARVERLLSEWSDDSEISAVNAAAGREPVVVGSELFDVISRSIRLSELTDGAFDVTFAACGHLWAFGEDPRIPTPDEVAECLPAIGYDRIRLDPVASSIFLPDPAMRLGIAAIGKGYGVDRAVAVLEARGITDYIVEGGGDVRLAVHPGGRPWKVGIAHPRKHGELYATLQLGGGAVVTSGDYEQFFERDGVIYHHILDPRTGYPARESVAVTVVAPNATDADALATGLFVLGPEAGLRLVESLPEVEALFFGPDLAVTRSSGFPEYTRLP